MKKLMMLVGVVSVTVSVLAQEAAKVDEPKANSPVREEEVRDRQIWPTPLAVFNYPKSPDVLGLRLTIPFSTVHENITGLDLGFWGSSYYFEGLQVNVLRCDVKDDFAGIQCGIYNSAGNADLFAVQCGLWNEAQCICGVQAGLVNVVGEAQGFQVGVINRAETLHGYQVGVFNIIRDAEVKFFPIVNIGF